MRGKKCKWIGKLISNYDVNFLLTMRNFYGEKTNDMSNKQLRRKARKIYKENKTNCQIWGKQQKGVK